ncbi:MAG: histone deacetylase [Fibrobacteria bacterium]|nr:histone deacetylase [Fibrobacteria bacterium]
MSTDLQQTGYVFNEVFINHVLSPGHPESPERLIKIQKRLKNSGLIKELKQVEALSDSSEFIASIHSPSHIESVSKLEDSGPIAKLAINSALGAVRDVCEGKLINAFCAIRPPGHHCHNNGAHFDDYGQGEGFCFYNNIAISARYAQQVYKLERILIIDWDYHHGNGTEWAFYNDPSVLFFSTHDLYGYPGTGSAERIGEGDGEGYNLNVPLEQGAWDTDALRAFEKKLLPAADSFKPQLILVSAGFDAHMADPLGTFNFSDSGFAKLSQVVTDIARRHTGGKLISFLEGGYNVDSLANAVEAHVGVLVEEAGKR